MVLELNVLHAIHNKYYQLMGHVVILHAIHVSILMKYTIKLIKGSGNSSKQCTTCNLLLYLYNSTCIS